MSGISGDMLVSNLLALHFPSQKKIKEFINSINLPDVKAKISYSIESVKGISGGRLNIQAEKVETARNIHKISRIINSSNLSDYAKDLSIKTFNYLGKIEARVHNIKFSKIHFHEIGAIDSIIDICLASELFFRLGNPDIYCSELPIGKGSVNCMHGLISNPPPAVQAMLADVSIYEVNEYFETVTPTGLALLKCFNTKFENFPTFQVTSCARSFGMNTFENIPNGLLGIYGRKQ